MWVLVVDLCVNVVSSRFGQKSGGYCCVFGFREETPNGCTRRYQSDPGEQTIRRPNGCLLLFVRVYIAGYVQTEKQQQQ